MAGDWIKMRDALIDHPKVIAMTRRLLAHQKYVAWLCPGQRKLPPLSDESFRIITVGLLLRVWSLARATGEFVGEDLVLPHNSLADLDAMARAPGVAAAMNAVGWATEDNGVTLPNFKTYNVPKTAAEKQRDYRSRQVEVTKTLPSDGNGALPNVTPRTEQNRTEETKEKTTTSSKERLLTVVVEQRGLDPAEVIKWANRIKDVLDSNTAEGRARTLKLACLHVAGFLSALPEILESMKKRAPTDPIRNPWRYFRTSAESHLQAGVSLQSMLDMVSLCDPRCQEVAT